MENNSENNSENRDPLTNYISEKYSMEEEMYDLNKRIVELNKKMNNFIPKPENRLLVMEFNSDELDEYDELVKNQFIY